MTLGIIVASIVLGSPTTPVRPDSGKHKLVPYVTSFQLNPGGGLCPLLMPIPVMGPMVKVDSLRGFDNSNLAQELQIVIRTDLQGLDTEELTQRVICHVREALKETAALSKAAGHICSPPTDPKQVIDPVMTGF